MKSLAEEPKTDYKSKYKDIRGINKEQRKRIQDGITKVGQLIVSYIFGQLLMLLMLSCSSASFEKNKWIPFSLLSLVSFIFWLSIIPTVSELLGILYEYDVSFMKQQIIFHRMYMVESGESQQQESSSGGYILRPDKDTLYRRYAYVVGLFSALLGFTGVMFYACHAFLREANGIIGKP